jgi:hypothetical protein
MANLAVLDSERTFVGVREVCRDFAMAEEAVEGRDRALAETAPQALLRDLHRPEITFEVSIMDFERHVIPRDGGRDAHADVKAYLYADYRVPIVELLTTSRDALEAMRDLKAILALPWPKAPKLGTRLK